MKAMKAKTLKSILALLAIAIAASTANALPTSWIGGTSYHVESAPKPNGEWEIVDSSGLANSSSAGRDGKALAAYAYAKKASAAPYWKIVLHGRTASIKSAAYAMTAKVKKVGKTIRLTGSKSYQANGHNYSVRLTARVGRHFTLIEVVKGFSATVNSEATSTTSVRLQ